MEEQTWRLVLGRNLQLFGKDGVEVSGLARKAEELLVILAIASPDSVLRSRAAALLWPHSHISKQHTNLRQCLKTLRQILPSQDFLEIERDSLALHPAKLRVERTDESELLIRHTTVWHSLLRSSETAARQVATSSPLAARERSATHSLEDLLDYMVQHQPNQALGLIYSTIDLATMMTPSRALHLSELVLRRSAQGHQMRGWALFLRAWALFFCNQSEASRQAFAELRNNALREGRGELLALTTFFEAGTMLPLGQISGAEEILTHVNQLDQEALRPRGILRLKHGMGLTAACKGDYEEGFSSLKGAIDLAASYSLDYERAYIAVNLAWMAASIGKESLARWALAVFDNSDTGASWRFRLTADLARIHLACCEGSFATGVALAEDALRR
nr:hypothetical protein [Fimbriimonadaceae bacterium]